MSLLDFKDYLIWCGIKYLYKVFPKYLSYDPEHNILGSDDHQNRNRISVHFFIFLLTVCQSSKIAIPEVSKKEKKNSITE